MSIQYITRAGSFDSGHRVMNERMKCFNVHGHTYLYELTFEFDNSKEIGYPVDFKEIKRVACEWIEIYLDHGFIANPKDVEVIDLVKRLDNKLWVMTLNGEGEYCNPTAENIAKELFLAIDAISHNWHKGLRLSLIKLWETPNCHTTCVRESMTKEETTNFYIARGKELEEYVKKMGTVEYDDRKVSTPHKTECGCGCQH
jgi:6-pyruvoyltetrahydropterin/6-carboxytetrahydropterin synthase